MSWLPFKRCVILFFADSLVLLAVTLLGFATHNSSLSGGRWLTTFLPLLFAWLAAAPALGLYSPGIADQNRQAWRAALAALLAAPLAVLVRGLWLQGMIVPVFGLVLMAVTAAGMILWRLTWIALAARRKDAWTKPA
ncbi:MAG: DUF3054 family protein [Chloroflexota bacterium]|jgi:lysylphosphatidylglycerol synthetase-like protein (DUF2156 family)